MVPILLALLLQSTPPPTQTPDLPVSLERIREGLARPRRFEVPPWRMPVFRMRIERPVLLVGNAWDQPSTVSSSVRPSMSAAHIDFLSAVTPDEVRSSAVHSCCDVLPGVKAATGFVAKRLQAAKQRRAKREVKKAMRDAGIRR